jgi:hypothetical protein
MAMRIVERTRAIARAEPVTLALLVGANLVPLVGVLVFGWDVFSVLFLYWIENGVVGVLNVPKILLTARNRDQPELAGAVVFMAITFPLHYGIFWLVHGVFIFVLAGGPLMLSTGGSVDDAVFLALTDRGLLLAALGLLTSHVAALLVSYVGHREYLRVSPARQMLAPYPRLIVLHLTIVLGGFAIVILGQPAALVALLVIGKTAIDLGLHFAERARMQRVAQVSVDV